MKKLKNSKNRYRQFAIGSIGFVMLTAAAFVVTPEIDNSSSALTCDTTTGKVTDASGASGVSVGDICDTANTGVNVNINEVLNIASVTINGVDYEPGSDATLSFGTLSGAALTTKSVILNAATNAALGYQLQMEGVKTVTEATKRMDGSATSNADLINTTSVDVGGAGTPDLRYPTIQTLSSDVASGSFPEGRWGYMITSTGTGGTGVLAADNVYKAVPSTSTSVRNYTWQGGNLTKATTFTFGVRPASNQAAGLYKGGVRFTVVSNSSS